ncbi:GNAT family N-acetyltransferase [Clostridium sp. AM33-3]|uniref:GNAT family N-acetyltransferase n=1 Tax=Clostridium sp. AM33-3 TaxID=2292304 RepID=UPI000E50D298|nr:GNAT family N-acetyltransferase [Clostridium sp. AM33-3]RHT17871.1 N-acetyltransferase [Clostridium sp. AM33-3]
MLQRINETNFPEIYRVMQASFSDDEYRPYDEQLALFEEPEYRIYYMPAGFLAVWEFESFIYIEHFAVDPALRNSGTGSAMLQELVKQYQKPICLEVELPEDELTRRRIGFYERNGFVFNEYPYIQPPISKGKSPVPLRIMTYKSEITREEFQKMKEILYRRVYKCGARI